MVPRAAANVRHRVSQDVPGALCSSPMDALALDKTVQACLATLGPDLRTIEHSPHSTIHPPSSDGQGAGKSALAALAEAGALADARLDLEGTLGQGGMGVVRLGTQRSLGRKVAVKTLLPEHRHDRAVTKLLREAWITSSLEHPNILPVHDLVVDEMGMPLVILKRIEGVDWSEVIGDDEAVSTRFGEERLEHGLRVLMQVCRAISFAHSRGVVHRDIKPENVRIGAFGEVYVIDWGIAVALEDDGSGRLPLAANAREIAGTPAYMAPEMLGGDIGPISERTDVYLLGATLYEVVVGRPPHGGSSAAQLFTSVLMSKPAIPDTVPDELGEVIRQAMSPDPDLRFASAEELRHAVQRFLDHRASSQLCEQAEERLAKLIDHLVAEGQDASHRVRAYDLFGDARSAFQAATDLWTGNERARGGGFQVLTVMIDYELGRGDARAAASLLDQLEAPDEGLRERVDVGLREQEEREKRIEKLERMGRDLDIRVGTRTRMFVGAAFALVWSVMPLLGQHLWTAEEHDSYSLLLGLSTVALVLGVALGLWARESLTKTVVNRRIGTSMLAMLSMHFVVLGGAAMMGLSAPVADVWMFFLWFATAAFLTITVERRLWPTAAVQLCAFLLASRWIELRYYFMSGAMLITTVNFVVAWRPPDSLLPPRINS